MRGPGDILLISCYELGHQPLAVAFALGALRRAGFAPAALDLAVERLDPQKVARARLVAISAPMHTALRLGVKAAERIRALNPSCRIVFFGLYAWLNASHLLERHGDFVIGGECEEPLVALASGSPTPVPGVAARGAPARPWIARPRPALPHRAALPGLDRYARLERDGALGLVGATEASRGCLHTCRHCPITPVYRGRFFVVPREVVLADVEQLVRAGATHISFRDPDFMNGPGHSMAVVREIHARWPALTFDATIKVEHIVERRALFPELAANGCLFVVSAFESLSDAVLARLEKGHTREDLDAALAVARVAGIALRPTFVAFTPWTTLEDYREMFAFVEEEELSVDPVQFTVRLLIPPGSALLEAPGDKSWLGPLAPDALSFTWRHPDPRMDELAHESAALVAGAAGEDPALTAARLRALAEGVDEPPLAPRPRKRVPRLTEPWFC